MEDASHQAELEKGLSPIITIAKSNETQATTTECKDLTLVETTTAKQETQIRTTECNDVDSEHCQEPQPSLLHLLLGWVSVSLLVMLVFLDASIIATVIPNISDSFNSLTDVGWYGSSYLLAMCAAQLPLGKIYKDFAFKPIILGSLLVFEVGSIVQASSMTSAAFIVGRVIAGIGGAGSLQGVLIIFSKHIPQKHVAFAMGSLGWIGGVGRVGGPFIGGAIAKSRLTWRWCFWINPIVSVPSIFLVLFLLNPPKQETTPQTIYSRLISIDWIGICLSIPAVVCFLAALQIGSAWEGWSSWKPCVLFAVSAVLLAAFLFSQWRLRDKAMLPFRLVRQRVVICSMACSALIDGFYYVLIYNLPLWFQAVQGLNPEQSALHTAAFIIPVIVSIFVSGAIAGKVKTLVPSMIFACVFGAVGSGLLTTLSPHTSTARWTVFQVIAGIGAGSGLQLPIIAVQRGLSPDDRSGGIAAVLTCGNLGASVAIAIAESVFSSLFKHFLRPLFTPETIQQFEQTGATSLRGLVSPQQVPIVVDAFNSALVRVFFVSASFAGLSAIVTCLYGRQGHKKA